MSLRDAWEAEAPNWIRWVREAKHDSYWGFHREAFFALVPPAGVLTLEIGCGEGRVARDLAARGHRVVGVDSSPTLVAAAQEADPSGDYRIADAAALPLPDGAADLVIAFMVLHDVENLDAVVQEVGRVLRTGGALAGAIVHPINAAGEFEGGEPGSPFVIRRSYLDARKYESAAELAELRMMFHSMHRPLEEFAAAFERAGLLVRTVREPRAPGAEGARWRRIPMFLDFVCVKM